MKPPRRPGRRRDRPPPADKARQPGRRTDTQDEPSKLPTRDEIKSFIAGSDVRVGKREVASAFGVKGKQRLELKRTLRELRASGDIEEKPASGNAMPSAMPAVGVVAITGIDADYQPQGHVVRKDEMRDPDAPLVTIVGPAGETPLPSLSVGDRVLCYLKRVDDRHYDGRAIRRIGSGPRRILGVYAEGPGGGRVTPTDRRLRDEFAISARDRNGANPGDVVWIESTGGTLARRARVLERIGSMADAHTVSLIAIAENTIPIEFPHDAVAQAEAAVAAPMDARRDLRQVPFVTIDGEDARDFDDAVFAEPDRDSGNAGGWHIMVAIADVAWYVRPADALDRSAVQRGNSVYFPDRVVPMLPEALSNGWCSLLPRQDRPTLVAEMWLDVAGKLLRHRFDRAMICSAERLTYGQVQAAHDGRTDAVTAPLVEPVLKPLYGAFRALLSQRQARGALDIDLPERQVIMGDDGHIAEIRPRVRLDSHRLIEEFMIAANVAAAETLERHRTPCMYRVHEPPEQTRIEALRDFLASLGISIAPGPRLRPRELDRILRMVSGTPHQRLVHETILRSQSQAVYAPANAGHFGLALQRYAHFTSPIRRYADLLVHRGLIRALSLGEGPLPADAGPHFPELGEQISACERRAVAAERGAMDRYMAAYMSDRVGAEFDAHVNGVARFGLFVTLDETGADGLIAVRTLGADFFEHDERLHVLRGRRTGQAFHLGDRLRVKLRQVEVATGSLNFELVEVLESVREANSQDRPRPHRPNRLPPRKPGRRR